MTTVIWSPSALHDLQGIRRYIEQFNPRAAKDMAARLIKAGDSLVKSPHRGRPLGDGTRAWSIVHPYIIRYEIIDDEVHILAIRHSSELR